MITDSRQMFELHENDVVQISFQDIGKEFFRCSPWGHFRKVCDTVVTTLNAENVILMFSCLLWCAGKPRQIGEEGGEERTPHLGILLKGDGCQIAIVLFRIPRNLFVAVMQSWV